MGVMCLILLGLSLLLLWDRRAGALSLVGAMVATTPMEPLELLGPQSPAAWSLGCDPAGQRRSCGCSAGEDPPGWVWAAAAAGGVALATARSSGPLFLVFIPLVHRLALRLRRGWSRACGAWAVASCR